MSPSRSPNPSGHLAAAQDPRTAALRTQVGAWFAENQRPLPWRAADRTPWGVLVSEIMLQQTPVVRVLPAWLAWMAQWPTAADVAAATPADVLRAWGRLGYPRRALRLHECARVIADSRGGRVPSAEAALLALPGVGAYTAAAVRAFAFGERSVVLDTNVRRVLARVMGGHALPAPSQTAAEVRLAAALVPTDRAAASQWAAASMELGALICTARAPKCAECPVAQLCEWRSAGKPPDAHSGRRRTQAWADTDRQVRGRVMALLRDSLEPVSRAAVESVWPDPDQLDRCLRGLVADRLAEELPAAQAYRLPAAASVQLNEHPGVAQRVRLDPREIQELRDAVVVGSQKLGVDVRGHRGALDRAEPVRREELDLERQAEQPRQAQRAGPVDERLEQLMPDAAPPPLRGDGQGADLGQVLPQHVQRAAADDAAVRAGVGDQELLDGLVVPDHLLREQDAHRGVGRDEVADGVDVRGQGGADGDLGTGHRDNLALPPPCVPSPTA